MADMKRPAVVARGAPVTIVLAMPGARLTARGQALDEGAVGDTVRVVNAHSRTTVSGVVRADGQVDVVVGAQPARRRTNGRWVPIIPGGRSTCWRRR
jgi:flagella basal body P-ring formation protein FlgA